AATTADNRLLVWGRSLFRHAVAFELPQELKPLESQVPIVEPELAGTVSWQTIHAGSRYLAGMDAAGRVLTWGAQLDSWHCLPSALTPFGRPSQPAAFQRVPSPVAGFGRDYELPADAAALELADVPERTVLLSGRSHSFLASVTDPYGTASMTSVAIRAMGLPPTSTATGYALSSRMEIPPLEPGKYWLEVGLVQWSRYTCGHREAPGNPRPAVMVVRELLVIDDQHLDASRPIVAALPAEGSLIEGREPALELTFARTGDLDAEFDLQLDWSEGVARPELDFVIEPPVIRFAPGQLAARASIRAIVDSHAEGVETARLKISASSAYQIHDLGSVGFEISDNRPPRVVVGQPLTGDFLAAGVDTEVIAYAESSDGQVGQLLLLLDDRPVAHVAPAGTDRFLLRFNWENPLPGTHTLQAIALDDLGDQGASPIVTIEVGHETPALDRVKLTAGQGRSFVRMPSGDWYGWGWPGGDRLNLVIGSVKSERMLLPTLVR
ncbi:MAG TPA: hypothetical protein DCY13_22630, partial [Verrucomicrobiales bacterium]|nr:hypothetical protein [Verrucomicrobiales bacterium]